MIPNKSPLLVGTCVYLSNPNHGGWRFGTMREQSSGQKYNISGSGLSDVEMHHMYEFHGEWGLFRGEAQLKVHAVLPHLEANQTAITRHLISSYKNLGKKTADELTFRWQADGRSWEELRQWLVYEPYKLEEWANTMPNLRKHLTYQESKDSDENVHVSRLTKALMLQFKSNDQNEVLVTDPVLRKIARHLLGLPLEGNVKDEEPKHTVTTAMERFMDNPFLPMFEVSGYAFKAADKIWHQLKKDRHHPFRLAALGWYALSQGCESDGHAFLTPAQFAYAVRRIEPTVDFEQALQAMVQQNTPFVEEADGFYPKHLHDAERYVAKALRGFLMTKPAPILSKSREEIQSQLHELQAKKGIVLDEQQHAALIGLATSPNRVHSLTAMPGCGKTAIMEFLAQLVQTFTTQSMAFLAPTGKASRVLNERVSPYGLTASTLHSAIGWGGLPQMVSQDIVVVDESSMVDLEVMNAFLNQVNPQAHLIFVGDADQLASVGPGQILTDLLQMPADHHRLERVHRNTGDILNLVMDIKRGAYDKTYSSEDLKTFGLPDPNTKMESLIDLYLKEVAARENGLQKVGLLTAKRRGDIHTPGWNVTYLNHTLQQRLNADGEKISGFTLRVNDRFIIRKNQRTDILTPDQPELPSTFTTQEKKTYLANGDTGTLLGVHYHPHSQKIAAIQLSLDDGRKLYLPADVLNSMNLGYALTVHQAQGSELECAFVFAENGPPSLCNRRLLYTGVSRAKTKLYLFGDKQVLRTMVARTDDSRNSRLVERINPSYVPSEASPRSSNHANASTSSRPRF
jgi:exodeoxyribonuclease V alpha subunit